MIHVLLTVGTNPIPVLAAAYRLAHHLSQSDSQLELIFLHSPETEFQAKAIKRILEKRFCNESIEVPLKLQEVVDASEPKQVYETVEHLANSLPGSRFHVHYTGGRKSMGIKAIQALGKSLLDDSYLDIVKHRLLNDRGRMTTTNDERKEWNVSLPELVELHGYTVDFNWRNRASFGAVSIPAKPHWDNTGVPLDTLVPIGKEMFDVLQKRGRTDNLSAWKNWRYLQDYVKNQTGYWPNQPAPEVPPGNPIKWGDKFTEDRWTSIASRINTCFGKECWARPGLMLAPSVLDAKQLAQLIALLNNGWLELAAFYYFREELRKRQSSDPRLHFEIYHSFRVTRIPEKVADHPVKQLFEIDVLALLGYQAILVSCTTSGSDRDFKEVKNKGFEAHHRALQIGGDAARAIVLCNINDPIQAQDLEDELHDETGASGRPLSIWGRDRWQNLQGNFAKYLDDIHWR